MVYVAGEQATASAPPRDGEAGAELDRLGDEIAELAAHVHAATYQLLARLRVFDERGGWGGGFYSCAHWLSWRTGIGMGTAREHVRVARALGELPQLSEAMRRGQLSFSKIRALTRIATPVNEAQLLELARQGTASHIEKIVRAWRRVDRLDEQRQERERHRARDLTLYHDDDGMYVVRGRLDPEVGALFDRVLAAASEALYGRRCAAAAGAVGGGDAGAAGLEDESTAATAGQRRADAIGLIAECALRHDLAVDVPAADNEGVAADPAAVAEEALMNNEATEAHDASSLTADESEASSRRPAAQNRIDSTGQRNEIGSRDSRRERAAPSRGANTIGRADRFQVVVHVDAQALRAGSDAGQSVLASGLRVPAETSRRLACDASRVVMTHDSAGNVLGVGRRTRSVPPAIRRVLDHRDQGCRFPGCSLRYCDAHHITHWADGGETRLDNLMMLCRRHHRMVHEEGFSVRLTESGETEFLRPDGQPLPDVPAAPELPDDPVASLAAVHRASGLEIDSSTAMSWWMGERLDLDFALLTLRGP